MATKCPRGSCYDEGGICGCGAGHEDPEMLVDDLTRLSDGENSCTDPRCEVCGKGLERHSEAQLAQCYPALSDPDARRAS